jgi:hypothetical protein
VAQLGRESEIFVICIYLFDPIFYEANESSSTCGPGFTLKVETFTPPDGTFKIRVVFENASSGIWRICLGFLLCALRWRWVGSVLYEFGA